MFLYQYMQGCAFFLFSLLHDRRWCDKTNVKFSDDIKAIKQYINKARCQYTDPYGKLFDFNNHKIVKVCMRRSFTNFFLKAVAICLLLIASGLIYFSVSNLKFFSDVSDFASEVKKERWIIAERVPGSYTECFDKSWVLSIIRTIDAKVMLRD